MPIQFIGQAPKTSRASQILGALSQASGEALSLFERIERRKQERDAANWEKIKVSAALYGGFGRLPQSVKNKIPALTGIPLDTNEVGDVIIEPRLQEQLDIANEEAIKKDPSALRVLGGLEQKAPSQAEMDWKSQEGEAERRLKVYELDYKRAMTEYLANVKLQAAGMAARARAYAADVGKASRLEAAKISRGSKDEPSGYYFDPETMRPIPPDVGNAKYGSDYATKLRPLTWEMYDRVSNALVQDSTVRKNDATVRYQEEALKKVRMSVVRELAQGNLLTAKMLETGKLSPEANRAAQTLMLIAADEVAPGLIESDVKPGALEKAFPAWFGNAAMTDMVRQARELRAKMLREELRNPANQPEPDYEMVKDRLRALIQDFPTATKEEFLTKYGHQPTVRRAIEDFFRERGR